MTLPSMVGLSSPLAVDQHRRWLILRLEAPLLSFGAVAIDHRGVTWDFPALSMLTGLFANALGWERTDTQAHQALEDRLVFASRREREPYHGTLRDTQNARLYQNDEGWTTQGNVEGRKQSGSFSVVDKALSKERQKELGKYQTHRRQRDYHPDALLMVAVTLKVALPSTAPAPTLDDLAAALDRPARPLFIGRKPCLPTAPIRERLADGTSFVLADTAHAALSLVPRLTSWGETTSAWDETPLRALWPANEGPGTGPGVHWTAHLADRRNWISGLHGGVRLVVEGQIAPPPQAKEATP